jgi:uncharacterized membrane protein
METGKGDTGTEKGTWKRDYCSSSDSAERLIKSLNNRGDRNPLNDKRVKIAIKKAIQDNDYASAKRYMKQAGWTNVSLYLNLDKFERMDGISAEAWGCKAKLADIGIDINIERESYPTSEFYFRNKCSQPVKLALKYINWNGKWAIKGWWYFESKDASYLASGGGRIGLSSSVIYYYARTTENADDSLVWEGEHGVSLGDEYLRMRKRNLSKDSDGDYVFSIHCTGH